MSPDALAASLIQASVLPLPPPPLTSPLSGLTGPQTSDLGDAVCGRLLPVTSPASRSRPLGLPPERLAVVGSGTPGLKLSSLSLIVGLGHMS